MAWSLGSVSKGDHLHQLLSWKRKSSQQLMSSFEYQSLDSPSTRIRLLRLLPWKGAPAQQPKPWYECADLECTLTIEALDTAPPYDALSYTWGDDDPSILVTINDKKTLVRQNLAYALAALRSSEPRVIWIDALCVNQDNLQERNHQVRLMGDIYRNSKQVLVWLGRPGVQMEFLATSAIDMMNRFGESFPHSTLPPPPPDPSLSQELQYEEWIASLQARYENGVEWNKKWGWQAQQWSMMKEDRAKLKLQRQRLPELRKELSSLEKSFIEKGQDLKRLQAQQSNHRAELAILQSSDRDRNKELDGPILRLLHTFKKRQGLVFEHARSMLMQEGSTAGTSSGTHVSEETMTEKLQQSHASGSRESGLSSVSELYKQIDSSLGQFQRDIIAIREKLEQKEQQRAPAPQQAFGGERQRLKELNLVDVSERRELKKLRKQLASWLQLENMQSEALRSLRESQKAETVTCIEKWDSRRAAALRSCHSWAASETQHYEMLKAMITKQIEDVDRLGRQHEAQWAQSPPNNPTIDAFLTDNELEMLACLKSHKRQVHLQLLAIRRTELQQREHEVFLQQGAKWQQSVYTMTIEMPSVEAEKHIARLQLIHAQAEWLKRWNKLRDRETKRWEDCVSKPRDMQASHTEPFFGIMDFCNLSYWSRLWIVQEVVLAKDIVLCFGDDARTTTSWDVLTKARSSLDQIPALWKLDQSIDTSIQTIKNSLAFQLDRLREGYGKGSPLHQLVQITQNALCRDPRDKIYGLLGLANDYRPGDIEIEYEQPIEEVFLKIIRWYHGRHGSEEGFPSLIGFSHALQLSFRNHDGSYNAASSQACPKTIQNLSKLSIESFSVQGSLKASVLPIEKLLGDTQLLNLRKRDWISIMLDYLDSSDNHMVRTRLEKELLYLSSIVPNFLLQPSSSSYAAKEQVTPEVALADLRIVENATIADIHRQDATSQFFILDNGQFGVSSTYVREGDVLCEFEDLRTALVLRRKGERYNLVSRAVLSPPSPADCLMDPSTSHKKSSVKRAPDPLFHVQIDAASLQQLTQPLEISSTTHFREPSYLLEADFGWYDFITFGIDTEVELETRSRNTTPALLQENEASPNDTQQSLPSRSSTPIHIESETVYPQDFSSLFWSQLSEKQESTINIEEEKIIWNKSWPEWIY